MTNLALSVLFEGAATQLSRGLEDCQALENIALSHALLEETVTLQAFDSLTQTLQQFQLLFQRLAQQPDVQSISINSQAIEQMTLAALRDSLSGRLQTSSVHAGEIELF